MPTNVDDFGPFRAIEAIERALRKINVASGHNTTPKVRAGAILLDKVPDGNFPQLAYEMGDLSVELEKFGGASQGIIRYEWPAFVWGYVKTTEGQRALYRAGSALFADVLSAIYADETLPDGNGQGTVLMITPGEISFDMESYHTLNKGYFVAEFRLVVDVTRGANP